MNCTARSIVNAFLNVCSSSATGLGLKVDSIKSGNRDRRARPFNNTRLHGRLELSYFETVDSNLHFSMPSLVRIVVWALSLWKWAQWLSMLIWIHCRLKRLVTYVKKIGSWRNWNSSLCDLRGISQIIEVRLRQELSAKKKSIDEVCFTKSAEDTKHFDKSIESWDSSVAMSGCAEKACKCSLSILTCNKERSFLLELNAMMFDAPGNIGNCRDLKKATTAAKTLLATLLCYTSCALFRL